MGVISHQQTWSFSLPDGSHTIAANIQSLGWKVALGIALDGQPVVQEEEPDGSVLWRDYPIQIGEVTCVVRAFKKGWLGVATEFELRINDQVIPGGQHVTIAPPAPPPVPPEDEPKVQAVPPEEAPATTVPVMPGLPGTCSACGAPLSMDQVKWVGPLSAKCPSCGTAVEVEWRRIG